MPFHVFIEKAVDPTPAGRTRLAGAIAARFKLPEAQIAQYLQAGRFRVKSNVDEVTARKFAGELQTLGAIVSVEDAQNGAKLTLAAGLGGLAKPPAAAAPPSPVPARAMANAATLPQPPVGGRGAAPGAPPPAVSASGQKFESGLAAAFGASSTSAPTDLSALDNLAGVSLSSLDGAEDAFSGPVGLENAEPVRLPTHAFEAPEGHDDMPLDLASEPLSARTPAAKAAGTPQPMPAAKAPAAKAPAAKAPAAAALAAPPPLDLEDDGPPVALAAPPPAAPMDSPLDLAAPAARAKASRPSSATSPPPAAPAAPSRRVATAAAASDEVEGGPLARFFAERPRQRLLAGAALALALGFGAATFYASNAEDDKYGKIRSDLVASYDAATTLARWEALDAPDGARTVAIRAAERTRGRIRTNAAAIWVLVSAGVAVAFFKKLA